MRRDRTFLFANVERTQLDVSGVITIRPEDAETINARLVSAG
jgi:hypothetical protein